MSWEYSSEAESLSSMCKALGFIPKYHQNMECILAQP